MARDANGNYTLPNSPVVTGTTITAAEYNSTMVDIKEALTDSLSRSGDGGMTSSMEFADGLVGAPSLAFANELTLGFYREGAGDLRFVVAGSPHIRFGSSFQIEAFRDASWRPLVDASSTQSLSADFTFTGDLIFGGLSSITVLAGSDVAFQGDVIFDNAKIIKGEEVGGTARPMIQMTASDKVQLGNTITLTTIQSADPLVLNQDTDIYGNVVMIDGQLLLDNDRAIAFKTAANNPINMLEISPTDKFDIGTTSGGVDTHIRASTYIGMIDEVRFYDNVLAQNEGGTYENFLTGVGTDNWVIGDTAQDLAITAKSIGVTFPVGMQLPNNVGLDAKEAGGTNRALIKMNASDEVEIGNSTSNVTFPVGMQLPNAIGLDGKEVGGTAVGRIEMNSSDEVQVGNSTSNVDFPGPAVEFAVTPTVLGVPISNTNAWGRLELTGIIGSRPSTRTKGIRMNGSASEPNGLFTPETQSTDGVGIHAEEDLIVTAIFQMPTITAGDAGQYAWVINGTGTINPSAQTSANVRAYVDAVSGDSGVIVAVTLWLFSGQDLWLNAEVWDSSPHADNSSYARCAFTVRPAP